MAYDYREAMKDDIVQYIEENINLDEYEDNEELYETLDEDLWVADSVTGNGSGSYTFNREEAKKYVVDNMDLVGEMIEEFDIDTKTIGEKFKEQDWEYFDVSIRCYLLGQVLDEVLEELGRGR